MLRRRMMMGQGGSTGPNYRRQELTFIARESGEFSFTPNIGGGTEEYGTIAYSIDDGVWVSAYAQYGVAVSTGVVSKNSKVKWRMSGLRIGTASSTGYGIGSFSATADFDVEGNIMSLQEGANFIGSVSIGGQHQFRSLFAGNTRVVSAENLILPATTLLQNCYVSMFNGCTALIAAPNLPATTLSSACYSSMFKDCTALMAAPELPATTLVSSCYYSMFSGCTSLNYIKCLATSISASNSHALWVSNVAASGTFVKAASMSSWPSGSSGIPSGWTVQNA